MNSSSFDTIIGTDIVAAADWLRKAELVAIPTETVYGLAGNALKEEAVLKIFLAKDRPRFNPLILHVPDIDAVKKYVLHISPVMKLLMNTFSPGPITFLLDKNPTMVSDVVTAGSSKVAVRLPAHPVTQALLKQLDFPLVAPSANRFGYVSPVTAAHVYEGLHGRIPYILDGGTCTVGVESTIVDEEYGQLIIRRTGKVSMEDIARIAGVTPVLKTHAEDHPVAPGMLKTHYATHTPLYLGKATDTSALAADKRVIIMGWGNEEAIAAAYHFPATTTLLGVISLSNDYRIDEVASKLFASMRNADNLGADAILVEPFPNEGIGQAINDRLQRASVLH